jgi:hypothetical protein
MWPRMSDRGMADFILVQGVSLRSDRQQSGLSLWAPQHGSSVSVSPSQSSLDKALTTAYRSQEGICFAAFFGCLQYTHRSELDRMKKAIPIPQYLHTDDEHYWIVEFLSFHCHLRDWKSVLA